jgi:hypothetical protein
MACAVDSNACIVEAAALLLMLVSACATAPPDGSFPAQKALIGKTESEVLACAGTPVRTVIDVEEGGDRVLFYQKSSRANEDTFPGSKSSVIGVRHGCTAGLRFKDGRVAAVEYQPSARGGIEHCEEIFSQCL